MKFPLPRACLVHADLSNKLFAFERDKRRFGTLKKMLAKARCRNVEPINADFLTVDPLDTKYSRVTHMYVPAT